MTAPAPAAWEELRRLANDEAKGGFPDRGFSTRLEQLLAGPAQWPSPAGRLAKNLIPHAARYRREPAARPGRFWGLILELKKFEMELLATPVQFLKGIGPERGKRLAKKGIETVNDLLHYYPRAYLDRRKIVPIGSIGPGARNAEITVTGRIIRAELVRGRGGRARLEAILRDETGDLRLTWFNARDYQKQMLARHEGEWLVSGKLACYGGWQLAGPELERIEAGAAPAGRIEPVYPETQGLTSRILRRLVRTALDRHAALLTDPLPQTVLARQDYPPLNRALPAIHFPSSDAELQAARERLKYQELFLMQLALLQRKALLRRAGGREPCTGGTELLAGVIPKFPFAFTAAQTRALGEIVRDMTSGFPMYRLLQGEVGSGKTAVAVAAAVLAARNGRQTAMMVPTELLAKQHYQKTAPLLEELGIAGALLIGSLTGKAKQAAQEQVRSGAAAIVFGTQALIQEKVAFRKLGLAVVDEQHRFGVLQRALLHGKGERPDQLVMTATPIPRTLALTVYGDMDVSVLDELPPGRLPVRTETVSEAPRALAAMWEAVRRELQAGHRAYIVFPLIDDSEELDLCAATTSFEAWRHRELAGIPCGLLHGRLKETEKEAVMEEFRAGTIRALFSTTVIEVGVDVPEATVMIVWDAPRFGVAQLHQLRGRVGRGRDPATCYLLSPPKLDPEKRHWLAEVARTNDGFRIAELDLRDRGQGDFLGTRQHGLPELQLANILTDIKLLVQARQDAAAFLAADFSASPARHACREHLHHYLRLRYGDRLQWLDA